MLNSFFSQLNSLLSQQNCTGWGMVFPKKDVQIGDSWEKSQRIELVPGAPIEVTSKMTLTGTQQVDGKTYLVIQNESTADYQNFTLKLPSLPGSEGTPQLTFSGHLFTQGTMLFDAQAGAIYSSSTTMRIDDTRTTISIPTMPTITTSSKMTENMQITRVD